MISKKEMLALSNISNGADDVETLSGVLYLSRPQTYKVVKSLSEKELAKLDHGKVNIEKKTHVAILLDILHDSPDSYIPLSDSGVEIISYLKEPHTVSELVNKTGLHQTTITRKIDLMRRMGMVKKKGTSYTINENLWPLLYDFAESYSAYNRFIDPRVPFGSEVIMTTKEFVLFATEQELDLPKTAFSEYGRFGITMYPGINYYCNLDHVPDIREVFTHSLEVVKHEKSWRNKMLSLIFYVKHKDELKDVEDPVIGDMRKVLNEEKVDGWVPLSEMQERAEMYGVDLYDN